MRLLSLIAALFLTGCPSSEPSDADLVEELATADDLGIEDEATADGETVTATCVFDVDSTLPGVSFSLEGNECRFTVAQAQAGITFGYRVIVEDVVKNVISLPLDAGFCDEPGPSGLRVFEKIHGNGQQYCICDEGLCMNQAQPVTMHPGSFDAVFEWDGVNWYGPSDTGNPKGQPFPPGNYTLVVRAEGKYGAGKTFAVNGTMVIDLLP